MENLESALKEIQEQRKVLLPSVQRYRALGEAAEVIKSLMGGAMDSITREKPAIANAKIKPEKIVKRTNPKGEERETIRVRVRELHSQALSDGEIAKIINRERKGKGLRTLSAAFYSVIRNKELRLPANFTMPLKTLEKRLSPTMFNGRA